MSDVATLDHCMPEFIARSEKKLFGICVVMDAMRAVVPEAGAVFNRFHFGVWNHGEFLSQGMKNERISTHRGEPLRVDSDSFTPLALSFFRDKDRVYAMKFDFKKKDIVLTPLEGVRLLDFKAVGLYYATDGVNSYYAPGGRVIKKDVLRALTLDDLTKGLANDKTEQQLWQSRIALGTKHVYFMGKRLKASDSNSFKKINDKPELYQDWHQVYYSDISTANNSLRPLPTIDQATFITESTQDPSNPRRQIEYFGDRHGDIYFHLYENFPRKGVLRGEAYLAQTAKDYASFFEGKRDDAFFEDFWYWRYE